MDKLLLVFIIILMGFAYWLVFYLESKKKKKGVPKKKQTNILFYSKWHYRFLRGTVTKNGYKKVFDHVNQLSLYTLMECRVQAVRFYAISTGVALLLFLVGSFLTQDLISVIMMFGFSVITKQTLVFKSLDNIRLKLYVELSAVLGSIRESYTIHQNIPDALSFCTKGPLIGKPIDEMYVFLTDRDSERKFNDFLKSNKNRLIQTLATACYTLNDEGDTSELDGGTSSFKQALLLLKNEVDDELEKLQLQKLLFNMLEYLPLAPVLCIKLVENFFISNIPGTSLIYNGIIGYLVKFLVILSALLGYYMISTINSPNYAKDDDRIDIITKLSRNRNVQRFINPIKPKRVRALQKQQKLFRGALSKRDVQYLYTEKVTLSVLMFIFSFIACIFIIIAARYFIRNSIQEMSMTGGKELTVEEAKLIRAMDEEILAGYPNRPDKVQLTNRVSETFHSWTELDVQDQVTRMISKYDNYYAISFKWWIPFVCYFFAVIAWFIPDALLAFRKRLVKSEALEDVLQMQTIIAILMHTKLDTLDIIYWLGKLSQIHKDPLVFCFHDYPSNPERSIKTLRRSSTVPEFIQICEKLLSTVDHTTIYESFADLLADRAHTMRMRKMVIEQTTYSKRQLASPFALAPLMILAVGYIILPIGILGFTSFKDIMSGI